MSSDRFVRLWAYGTPDREECRLVVRHALLSQAKHQTMVSWSTISSSSHVEPRIWENQTKMKIEPSILLVQGEAVSYLGLFDLRSLGIPNLGSVVELCVVHGDQLH